MRVFIALSLETMQSLFVFETDSTLLANAKECAFRDCIISLATSVIRYN